MKYLNKTNLYLLVVALIGCSLFAFHINISVFEQISSNPLLFILLLTALILLTHYTIPLPPKGNSLCMDSSIYLATLFIFGLELSLMLSLFSVVLYSFLERGVVWWKHMFNFSIYALMILGGYYSLILFGGQVGLLNTSNIFPYIFSLISYFIINLSLIGIYFYLNATSHFLLGVIGKEALSNYLITLASAFILALLFETKPVFGLVIFTIIILLVSLGYKKYFRLYEEMSKDKTYREQILNSLPVGIITVDNESSNYSLNTAASSLINLDGEEIKEIVGVRDGHVFNQNFWEILSAKKICKNVKVTFTKEKVHHQLLVSQSKLLDQEQHLIGRIFYFIDITETEELEKRIHQSEKLAVLGELAAGAAHEIRNPLAVIHGFLTLMKQSFSEKETNKFQIPLLLKEFERINTIIEEMLMMAKPGAPVLKEVYLEDVIREIPYYHEHANADKGLVLNIELERLPLLIDPKQMKQVIYNLLRNSREAMNDKGTICLFSEVTSTSFKFFIRDTGSGISPEMENALFHPFSTSKETGTGLGLPIVQRIVENHKGKIEMYETSHKGTTFLITLPLPTKQ